MNVLGINAYHADVSAVLFSGNRLVAAVEEERFRRIKHVAGFPSEAIRACLEMGGLQGSDIHHVAISRRPRAHVWRKALFALRYRPAAGLVTDRARNYRAIAALPDAVRGALGLGGAASGPAVHWVEHHPAHLASAFFVSPFESAAVLAVDGFGDFVSTSWGTGAGRRIDVAHRTFFPHSLGLLYLALTQHLGFPGFGDEFKVMGLAPYGRPVHADLVRKLIQLRPRGRFSLDLSYFQHWTGAVPMTWDAGEPTIGRVFTSRLEELLGPARSSDEPLEPRHEDLAASVQAVFEEALFHVASEVARTSRRRAICLAGGCAMNSVANGKLLANTAFDAMYVQPAGGDNGTALGAALWVRHQVLGVPRDVVMTHAGWGPEFDSAALERAIEARRPDLDDQHCVAKRFADEEALCRDTAAAIAEGRVVGWFQGRMEWGARALGHRSILADPRRPDMRDIINTKIKFRERFRPFAPSVLAEAVDEYFEGATPDPFMAAVYPVRETKRGVIPAVTHVDGSGRIQAVTAEANPTFHRLIRAFAALTGVPVLLNTSFNENEPIVHRPDEALDCFLRTRMDVLVLGPWVIRKG